MLPLVATAGAFVAMTSGGVVAGGPERATMAAGPARALADVPGLEKLFCEGPLLDAVQRAHVFNDSKSFVDMPLKPGQAPDAILAAFQTELAPVLARNDSASANATRAAVHDFLERFFDAPGADIRQVVPADYHESPMPPRIAAIAPAPYRDWAMALHKLWKELGRSPDPSVHSSYLRPTPLPALHEGDDNNQQQQQQQQQPPSANDQPLIVVPGGRFRESYYWDSYWIVEGLLISGMRGTARRVVRNLLEYVAEYGFVPNGGRIYYLTRSQPPMLSDMVRLVAAESGPVDKTWDHAYLAKVLPLLEKEYEYWMTTHAVQINQHVLNRYVSTANIPRPESYREDVELAETTTQSTEAAHKLYNDIIAGAESGWDFSSRWFRDGQNLSTIDTMDVIPVDLNAILHRVEQNLALFNRALGNRKAAKTYTAAAERRRRAMDAVFWHAESNSWRDFLMGSQKHSSIVSVSNYFPLWARAFDRKDTARVAKVVESFRQSGLIQVAGVQTTTTTTVQQWDAPNAWPPLQDIIIEGLLEAERPEATKLAHELTNTWIETNYAAWKAVGLMFEKYNTTVLGGLGTGGEYTPQFGFGWTNGVVLKFLTKHADVLKPPAN